MSCEAVHDKNPIARLNSKPHEHYQKTNQYTYTYICILLSPVNAEYYTDSFSKIQKYNARTLMYRQELNLHRRAIYNQ